MISLHKKYLIARNKKAFFFIIDKISKGVPVVDALQQAAESNDFTVSYGCAKQLIYNKEYFWSPYFEYDKKGNVVFLLDISGAKIVGSETKFYKDYMKEKELKEVA
ncbi:MAG: hypothetical protein COA50_01185 [Flavobacteriaceae bacterium]|nr:MAG: hypothetical protein COA50_01185 [Flavobacteriaceae bacterium]